MWIGEIHPRLDPLIADPVSKAAALIVLAAKDGLRLNQDGVISAVATLINNALTNCR